MPGRTADISTSSFKPLSLDEIMMVPLAKQKMEDDFLAKSDKFSELEASTASVDQERASRILGEFKGRASGLSDNIINSGVSRSEFNKLRSLKSEVQNEYGSEGFIGNAIANKKAMGTFINDLATKKERQAGWSPQEAQQWARMEAAKFNKGVGTQNEDGTFNSFTGSEMASKVNEIEWLRKNVGDIAKDISPIALRKIEVGGLPAFKQAFADGSIEEIDYNTVMRHLSLQAGNDVDLQRSLNQSASLTGEEDPLDHGKFVTKNIVKEDGTIASTQVWTVGKSRFGSRMAGIAGASSYRNVTVSNKIEKDDVGFALWGSDMEEKQVAKLVAFADGELTDVTRQSLSELETNLELAVGQTDIMLTNVNKQKQLLLSEDAQYQKLSEQLSQNIGQDPKTEMAIQKQMDLREQKVLAGNDHYNKLQADYSKAATKYTNAKYSVEAVYSAAEKTMNPRELENYNINRFVVDNVPGYSTKDPSPLKRIAALENAIRKSPGGEGLIPEEGMNMVTIGEEEMENFLTSKYLELQGYEVDKTAEADQNLYSWFGSGKMSYDPNIVSKMRSGGKIREKKVENILAANPKAQSYTILTANSTSGLKAPAVSQNNQLLKGSLVENNMQMAFDGGLVNDDLMETLLESSDKGYSYTPEMTDSWDRNGDKIVNITAKNLETGAITTFPIINNLNEANDLVAAEQLMRNGSPKQTRVAKKIIAGYKYMPGVKKSGMDYQNKGEIGGLPFTDKSGKELKIQWEKAEDGSHFTASINGMPLKKGQAIYGEEDMVNVIYDYVNAKYEAEQAKKNK
jgi:hypothetical protein